MSPTKSSLRTKRLRRAANKDVSVLDATTRFEPDILTRLHELGIFDALVLPHLNATDQQLLRNTCRTLHELLPEAKLSMHHVVPHLHLATWALQKTIGEKEERLKLRRKLCEASARVGNLQVLQMARKRHCWWGVSTFRGAMEKGHFDLFQWAYRAGCQWDSEIRNVVAFYAAYYGNIQVVQWALDHDCWVGDATSTGAVMGGQLGMLKWLCELGCPLHDADASEYAAKSGNLAILKYLHQQGCLFDEETCSAAAGNGHLETLRWLREQGCPWHEGTCARAALWGHWEVLQWAHGQGCPCGDTTCFAIAVWSAKHNLNVAPILASVLPRCAYASFLEEQTEFLDFFPENGL